MYFVICEQTLKTRVDMKMESDECTSATTFVPQFTSNQILLAAVSTFDVHAPHTLLYSRHLKPSNTN